MDKEEWLIRTKELFISRPLKKETLIQKIEKGDLSPLDEICPATGYWFSLHEAAEVRKHLGDINLGKLSSGVEIEITSSTETSTIKKTLILDLPKSWPAPGPEQKSMLSVPVQKKAVARGRLEEVERQWTPAFIFGVIFTVVLIFLWMNSD